IPSTAEQEIGTADIRVLDTHAGVRRSNSLTFGERGHHVEKVAGHINSSAVVWSPPFLPHTGPGQQGSADGLEGQNGAGLVDVGCGVDFSNPLGQERLFDPALTPPLPKEGV
ncbi:hypothetical protein A2U01_0064942, partial [Trifolium medium]|nr:hypothetical protein [Trifolium medium]